MIDSTKNTKLNIKSSNEDVLKVDDNKIYAVGVGNATITARADFKEESFKYNIVAKLKSISVKKKHKSRYWRNNNYTSICYNRASKFKNTKK